MKRDLAPYLKALENQQLRKGADTGKPLRSLAALSTSGSSLDDAAEVAAEKPVMESGEEAKMPAADSTSNVGSNFEQAAAAHALLAAELEDVLNESASLKTTSQQANAGAQAGCHEEIQDVEESPESRHPDGANTPKPAGSGRKAKKAVVESVGKLAEMMADMAYVRALDLHTQSSVKILAEWSSKRVSARAQVRQRQARGLKSERERAKEWTRARKCGRDRREGHRAHR